MLIFCVYSLVLLMCLAMLLLLLFSSELTFNFVTSLISPCSISLILFYFHYFFSSHTVSIPLMNFLSSPPMYTSKPFFPLDYKILILMSLTDNSNFYVITKFISLIFTFNLVSCIFFLFHASYIYIYLY